MTGETRITDLMTRQLGRPLPAESSLPAGRQLRVNRLAGDMLNRWEFAQRAGLQFGTDRDLYLTFGYLRGPVYKDYLDHYKRDPTARRIINLPVTQTWRKGGPAVVDGELDAQQADRKPTTFETAAADLTTRLRLWHYCSRVDRLASLGRYALLLIGSTGVDSAEADALMFPLERDQFKDDGSSIGFLRVFAEDNVKVARYEDRLGEKRYGQPLIYKLQFRTAKSGRTVWRRVHYSRVVHVADAALEDDLVGEPRLAPVLNTLYDGAKISGSAAESYWQRAAPTWHANWDAEAELGSTKDEEDETLEELEEDMLLALHRARRVIMTRGVEIEPLGGDMSDPKGAFDVHRQLAAAGSGIAQRVLFGSERGELASSQDWELFIDEIDDRRLQYAEPVIVRPFFDRLIEMGAMPKPSEETYSLDWPDLRLRSEDDEAKVAETRAGAFQKMADARVAGMPATDAEIREILDLPAINPDLEADDRFRREEGEDGEEGDEE